MFQESQGAVYFVVLVAVVLSPVEERGEAYQNPAEAELKVSQDVDGEDDGKRLAKFNPHLGDIGQRGLRLLQLPRGQRWADGGADGAVWCCDGTIGPHPWRSGTLHPVTVS